MSEKIKHTPYINIAPITEGISSAFRSEYRLLTSKYSDSYESKIATTDKKIIAIKENTVQNTGPNKKYISFHIPRSLSTNIHTKYLQQPTGACCFKLDN